MAIATTPAERYTADIGGEKSGRTVQIRALRLAGMRRVMQLAREIDALTNTKKKGRKSVEVLDADHTDKAFDVMAQIVAIGCSGFEGFTDEDGKAVKAATDDNGKLALECIERAFTLPDLNEAMSAILERNTVGEGTRGN